MIWQQWVLVAIFAVGSLVTIANVGRERKPTTGLEAAIVVAVQALTIVMVVSI